jgi:cyclophilin family peptidyl-prolyl cis-trans isomerase
LIFSGGNFVDLVNKGFYNNKVISRSDGFVIQTGDADPAGTVHGYVQNGEERKV